MNRHREVIQAIRDVATNAGAHVTIVQQGKHPRAVLHYQGRHRFIVISRTPSDRKAAQISAQDARRALRHLGATT